jgi:hypothetical protein
MLRTLYNNKNFSFDDKFTKPKGLKFNILSEGDNVISFDPEVVVDNTFESIVFNELATKNSNNLLMILIKREKMYYHYS